MVEQRHPTFGISLTPFASRKQVGEEEQILLISFTSPSRPSESESRPSRSRVTKMVGGGVSATGPVIGETRILSKANVRPLFYCSLAVMGAILYGYDGTYFTAILEMKKFKEDYGHPITLPDGTQTIDITSGARAGVTSAIQAGEFFGALFAGPIGDLFGRRGAFFMAISFLTLGTILQLIIAGNLPLLGLGRGFVGMGVGAIANCCPLYLSEISTAAIRGAVVGSWQLLLAIGQVVGACVGQGKTYKASMSRLILTYISCRYS